MTLACNSSQDASIALGSITNHSHQDCFCTVLDLSHQYNHMWWPKPWASSYPSVVTGTMDISTDTGMGFGNSSGPEVTTTQVAKEPAISALSSLPLPLQTRISSQDTSSPSYTPTIRLLTILTPDCLASLGASKAHGFFSQKAGFFS